MSYITFIREYGVNQVPAGNETVTTVSQPDWRRFTASLDALQTAGRFILSPELMAVAGIDLDSLQDNQGLVADRVAEAAELSRRFPRSILLLGSAAFTHAAPRNVVLFLRDGKEVGRTHKRYLVGVHEREVFEQADQPSDLRKPMTGVMAIIGSDILKPPPIGESVTTLLVSACWNTPLHPDVQSSSDQRQVGFLTRTTDELFDEHENLRTIIMVDRVPQASADREPLNFVARR